MSGGSPRSTRISEQEGARIKRLLGCTQEDFAEASKYSSENFSRGTLIKFLNGDYVDKKKASYIVEALDTHGITVDMNSGMEMPVEVLPEGGALARKDEAIDAEYTEVDGEQPIATPETETDRQDVEDINQDIDVLKGTAIARAGEVVVNTGGTAAQDRNSAAPPQPADPQPESVKVNQTAKTVEETGLMIGVVKGRLEMNSPEA